MEAAAPVSFCSNIAKVSFTSHIPQRDIVNGFNAYASYVYIVYVYIYIYIVYIYSIYRYSVYI